MSNISENPPTFFLNLYTNNLPASKAFYQALGFTHIPAWSDDNSTSFTLPSPNDRVALMIHTVPRFKDFIRPGSDVADPKKASQALYSIFVEGKEEVDEWQKKAVEAGGEKDPFVMEGYGEEMGVYSRSWTDLDGHIWEVVTMLGDGDACGAWPSTY